jgi:hypothetical protein
METPPPTADELADVQNMYKISQNGAISIQTLICNVLLGKKKRGTTVKTVVLIDSGSSVTCIDKDFALEHNLRILGRREGMTLHMLKRIVKLPEDQFQVELQLSSVDQNCMKNITAWTVKNLAKHTSVVDWSEKKKQFPYLKDIKFPEMPEDLTIKIIMGVDNTAFFTPVETIRNPDNETDLTTIRLSLGWTCVGRSCPSPNPNEANGVFTNVVFKPKNRRFQHQSFKIQGTPNLAKTDNGYEGPFEKSTCNRTACEIMEDIKRLVEGAFDMDTLGIKDKVRSAGLSKFYKKDQSDWSPEER